MYTSDGINLANMVLINREQYLATHIVLGIDTFSSANGLSTISNRYHSPYIVDEISIANIGLLRISSPTVHDELVFAGQASMSSRYLANSVGLVMVRNSGSNQRSMRTIVNVGSDGWTGGGTPAGNEVWPTIDGGKILAQNTSATYTGAIDLSAYGSDDVVSVPVYFVGGTPTNGVLTITFNYLNGSTPSTYSITDTVSLVSSKYKFNNGVGGAALSTVTAPIPHAFQRKLGSGTGWATFSANLNKVTGITYGWATSTSTLYVGSLIITPNYASDTSRICVAYKDLNAIVRKTTNSAFLNAEYRLNGMSA